jgi:hypothetical protein
VQETRDVVSAVPAAAEPSSNSEVLEGGGAARPLPEEALTEATRKVDAGEVLGDLGATAAVCNNVAELHVVGL